MSIIGLIILLIVVGVLFWAVRALSGAFGIPQPIVTVIYVLLVVIVLVWVLNSLGFIGAGVLSRPLR